MNGSATIGYSPTLTANQIQWKNGPKEFLRCSADILLNGLAGDLEGEARCPVCQGRTSLVISGGRIKMLNPEDAIIHVVELPDSRSWRPWIECESTHIFDRKECFEKWNMNYTSRKGIVSSIQNYYNSLIARKTSRKSSA